MESSLALQFRNKLAKASSVVIGTHVIPDGDALGSALALSHYLDGIGVRSEVLNHDPAPKNLMFLPGIERLRRMPSTEDHDLAVMLDLDAFDRLGSVAPWFSNCRNLIVVDHHVPREAPGNLRIVDERAAATAQILTRLFLEMDADITPAMATCLLTGIVTDTGSFRYRNTTPESMMFSSILLENGGDLNLICEEVYQSNSLAATRLYGHMLKTMRLACDNRLAIASLRFEDYAAAGATDEDAEEFGNQLLTISDVKIAALLRESVKGKVRCSIRSRQGIDVASVAREFGGGGRATAAGCTFELPVDEVEALLLDRLSALL